MIRIVSIAGFSKQGRRDNNEDYILYREKESPDSRFIILCDGMGGHGHGEIASQTVADTVFEYLKSLGKEKYEDQDLQDALDIALSTLTAVDAYDDKKSMGTTLVVAVINKMEVLVGHVGDSRCYLFDENGLLKFRTKDHSKVAEAVEAEILTEEEAHKSAYKNILTRCVMSGKTNVQIEIDHLQIENNDRLFICSDGINDAMRDKEIEELMVNRGVSGALEMIDSICSEKSNDNYSAIIADLLQDENNPKADIAVNQQILVDSEDEDYIDCQNCGERNDSNAKFCRKCGAKLGVTEQTIVESQGEKKNDKGNVFLRLIKKSFPFICFILGCFLTMAYYKTINYQDEKERLSNISKIQAKDLYFRKQFEDASISFISNLCTIDSTKNVTDSVLHKDTLKNKYMDFCQKYNSSEKR